MLHLLNLIPAGSSYVRIPRSKAAAMRLILETVQRGSRYWTGGVISTAKALGLAEKFAHRYDTDASASRRARNKARGQANATLILYPEDEMALSPVRWWLLVTPGSGQVHAEEQLNDTWSRHQRLTWGEQYELLHLQRPRDYGGGRRWTWQVTTRRMEELEAAMGQLARGHGSPSAERTDDLAALVAAIQKMPGFHGIRMQQRTLYHLGEACWNRTHRAPFTGWPQDIPYVDKRQPVYHRPNALTLDILVRMWEWRQRQCEAALPGLLAAPSPVSMPSIPLEGR